MTKINGADLKLNVLFMVLNPGFMIQNFCLPRHKSFQ